MSNEAETSPGALVRCPGCGGEVHVSEIDGDPESRFRCRACTRQKEESMRAMHPELFQKPKGYNKDEQPDSDRPIDASPAGKRARGNQAPQQPPNV